MDMVVVLIGVAWLAIVAVLVAGAVNAFRKGWSNDAPLPLFRELERRGSTPERAGELLGAGQLAHAARRCTYCVTRWECEHGPAPAYCPNEEILRRVSARGALPG
jgi:hypothetical protein